MGTSVPGEEPADGEDIPGKGKPPKAGAGRMPLLGHWENIPLSVTALLLWSAIVSCFHDIMGGEA